MNIIMTGVKILFIHRLITVSELHIQASRTWEGLAARILRSGTSVRGHGGRGQLRPGCFDNAEHHWLKVRETAGVMVVRWLFKKTMGLFFQWAMTGLQRPKVEAAEAPPSKPSGSQIPDMLQKIHDKMPSPAKPVFQVLEATDDQKTDSNELNPHAFDKLVGMEKQQAMLATISSMMWQHWHEAESRVRKDRRQRVPWFFSECFFPECVARVPVSLWGSGG